ncbi:hypothetical protein OQH61_05615 [Helicobacter sp. MIT 21-1697]|uniref:hypothetical protein n=1 Tax=Helicobacter sp. MIT 21-1697 TaxID=2993733 RepID=UPI00224AB4B5|nr:hypothetical protein [Helicobacter sp. MIT 21-1697]MCX2717211.1 hypothetical protein [Helicobacter sp. MIT 21-1697]
MKKMLMVAFIVMSMYGDDVTQKLKAKVNDLSNVLADMKSNREENNLYFSKHSEIIDAYLPYLNLARQEGDSFSFDALVQERDIKLIPIKKEMEKLNKAHEVLLKEYEKIQKELGGITLEFSKTHTDVAVNRFVKAAKDKKNIEDKKCEKMYIPKLESNKCSPMQKQKSQMCKKLEREFHKCLQEVNKNIDNVYKEYYKAEENLLKSFVSN